MEYVLTFDPKKEWPRYCGFWIRIRGILSFVGLDVLLAIFTYLNVSPLIATSLGAFGVGGLVVLLLLRYEYLRCAETDIALHWFAHNVRDDVERLMSFQDSSGVKFRLAEFHNNTAQRIAEYFSSQKRDQSVGCCIRIALVDKSGQQQYTTVGRSQNYEPSRNSNSIPVPANKGIPHFLLERKNKGVLIVRDIQQAITKQEWHETENDSLSDIVTLMVSPINGYVDGSMWMVGLLYITSRKDPFAKADTSSLKAIADIMGMVYSRLFTHFSGENLIPPSVSQQAKQARRRKRRK